MAKRVGNITKFSGGISDSSKEGIPDSFQFGRSIDFRSDAKKITILPRTTKISGTVVVGLPKWAERQSTDTYIYDNTGHIYKRDSSEVWTDLRTVSNSTGNGMKYYGEDLYLYYTSDTVIGRYGPFGGTKTFADDFLGAQGGVPLNTHSLDLELSSSMYATAADDATLSITGDITIEGCFKMESLPAAAAQMVLVSKWDLNSDERSYKFDLAGISGYFGDSGGGALTISADTTQAPTDSACTGTAAAYSLTATNTSFATDDKILIHQSRGTNAGQWEENEIASYTAGTITLANALKNTYTTGAQVIVLPEYTNVTVNTGKTWTAKAWNGTVGGILAFKASGTVTITGTISANTKGFRGGSGAGNDTTGYEGEGTAGASDTRTTAANGSGAGGGGEGSGAKGGGGGGGGGHGVVGSNGGAGHDGGVAGTGGAVGGSADLTSLVFGGGGGGGGASGADGGGTGGTGGGIVFITGATVTITGAITTAGSNGTDSADADGGCGGGGAGGSVLIKAQTATLGTILITAAAGSGATGTSNQADGGNGAVGRIHLDYYTSYTGTTTPTLDYAQDENLVTTTSYQLRLSVCSTDGAVGNVETLAKTLSPTPVVDQWYRYAVKWDASAKQANFFVDGVDLGQATGAKTSIYDSTALFAIGASLDAASDDENWFDGKVDDIRIWNDLRTDAELDTYKEVELSGGEAGLAAYYQVDNSTADSSANTNTLTLVNSPTYDADDVPFSSPTTRQDLDQSLSTSGQTYTLAVAIDEGATHRQTFVPAKEPLKSIEVLLAAKGTGDWTLTVHDALNREIGAKTIVTADLLAAAGDVEFIFATPLRVVLGASYHFHLTDTTADGTVTTTTNVDLETVDYHSYFSFLVDDAFHPIEQIVNKLAIGNERYLATWDAGTYTPHKLTFPSGHRVRALGFWREYLAIGTWKGTNIYDYDEGRIFFWDGTADTYNFYIDVPEGGINALLGARGLLYIWAGYSGDMLIYNGGEFAQKVKRLPKITTDKYVEIFPGAVSMWQSLVHFGVAGNSDSTDIEKGVYTWGSLNRNYVESFGYDYPLSVGTRTGTGLKIGMVKASGQELLIGWQLGTSYGVDKVAVDNAPYPTATFEALIADLGSISRKKYPLVLRADFEPLVTGESVILKYKIDRESAWKETLTEDTADAKEARLLIKSQAKEIEIATDLETTVSTAPTVTGISLESEGAEGEINA